MEKEWLARNQDIVSEWSEMIKIKLKKKNTTLVEAFYHIKRENRLLEHTNTSPLTFLECTYTSIQSSGIKLGYVTKPPHVVK